MFCIQRLALGNLDRFPNEWYEKNPKHLSFAWCSIWKRVDREFRGENRLGTGAVLRSFPPLSFSYYFQVNAERKTFKNANIRHLQLQGRQNTTIKVLQVYIYFEEKYQHYPRYFAFKYEPRNFPHKSFKLRTDCLGSL